MLHIIVLKAIIGCALSYWFLWDASRTKCFHEKNLESLATLVEAWQNKNAQPQLNEFLFMYVRPDNMHVIFSIPEWSHSAVSLTAPARVRIVTISPTMINHRLVHDGPSLYASLSSVAILLHGPSSHGTFLPQ